MYRAWPLKFYSEKITIYAIIIKVDVSHSVHINVGKGEVWFLYKTKQLLV